MPGLWLRRNSQGGSAGRTDTQKTTVTGASCVHRPLQHHPDSSGFHFSSDSSAGGLEVQQASLMFFCTAPPTTCPLKVRVLELSPRDTNLTSATQHLLEVNDSGWHPASPWGLKLRLLSIARAPGPWSWPPKDRWPGAQSSWLGLAHRPFVDSSVRVGASTVSAAEARLPGQVQDVLSTGVLLQSPRSDGTISRRIIQPEGYAR